MDVPLVSNEAVQAELIYLAQQQARQQLEAGTAPPSVLVTLLKLGSTQAELDLERARAQTALFMSKANQIEYAARMDQLSEAVLDAMRQYSGYFQGGDGGAPEPPNPNV